ncbi:hypothetical protein S7711_05035 [Stachybotrys chartarum IBT 7711]|uniref:GST N-terminal domain-containing protein n=1 Tax=Stachybotrys chartarum (strain CBS 109288 / IBT 7711) TaxID=1280523 RepID=A0A084BAM5_STACB|nr:hypothetical protein S7711_05035 [Stachybotrys chartarum IBT 7711]
MATTTTEHKTERNLEPVLMFNHVGMHMPNAWKICFLVKELGLECDMQFLDFTKNEQKKAPHIDYNPNGRIPTFVDRNNNNFPVWESNAILMYLMDRYDSENKTGFLGTTPEEKAQVIQWLFFQASGQDSAGAQRARKAPLGPGLDGRITMHPGRFRLAPVQHVLRPRLLPEGVTIDQHYSAVAAWQARVASRASVLETIREREVQMREFASSIPIFRGEKARMEPVFPFFEGAVVSSQA